MDHRLYLPSAIDPETAAYNTELERQLAAFPALVDSTPEAARAARERGESAFGPLVLSDRAESLLIGRPDGQAIATRVFRSPEPKGVYLHIHGGGWVLGATHHQDARLEYLADACSVTVVSIDYRLAPEHRFPAAVEDCVSAALWMFDHAMEEFGSDRIVIGGESAGAHLSVATLLRLRDRHGSQGVLGANLVYGWYDLRLTPSARSWGDRMLVLNTPTLEWFADHFVAQEQRNSPEASPLLADLAGMPPALFTVGTLDPLLDDTLFMYQRWVAAGNAAGLAIYPGGAHGFDAFGLGISDAALQGMHRFVAGLVAGR